MSIIRTMRERHVFFHVVWGFFCLGIACIPPIDGASLFAAFSGGALVGLSLEACYGPRV